MAHSLGRKPSPCKYCGYPVYQSGTSGAPASYCSARCRQYAYRARLAAHRSALAVRDERSRVVKFATCKIISRNFHI